MSDEIIKWFYKDTDFKKYNGYRLLGIDGNVLEINNTEKLRNEFNRLIGVLNQKGETTVYTYDLNNNRLK